MFKVLPPQQHSVTASQVPSALYYVSDIFKHIIMWAAQRFLRWICFFPLSLHTQRANRGHRNLTSDASLVLTATINPLIPGQTTGYQPLASDTELHRLYQQ